MSDTPEADALEKTDRFQVAQISCDNPPYDRMYELARRLERELNVSRAINLDDCHTDTLCRDAARPVLGDWVDGDNCGVPTTADIVDRLVNMVILSANASVELPPEGGSESNSGAVGG